MGFYCKVTLIACFFGVAAPAHAQVRVITGDIEHFYGSGGELLAMLSSALETSGSSDL